MDESAFPGCAVQARLIGVIEGEQIDGKKKIRNDRLVAVADANHMYANVKKLKDLPSKWVKELEVFFVNYHNLGKGVPALRMQRSRRRHEADQAGEERPPEVGGCQDAEDAITLAHSFADDVRSSFGRYHQSQNIPLPACRVVSAHLYTAIDWHSVLPREEAIPVSLPSQPESISAERVHVEVGKAGPLHPFG